MDPAIQDCLKRMSGRLGRDIAMAPFLDWSPGAVPALSGGLGPVGDVPLLTEDLPESQAAHLDEVAVIRHAGELATEPRPRYPQVLVQARGRARVLDLLLDQHVWTLRQAGSWIPLALLTSAWTDDAIRPIVKAHEIEAIVRKLLRPKVKDPGPSVVSQTSIPRLDFSDAPGPVSYPRDRSLEWAPAGDGAVFATMFARGLLTRWFSEFGRTYVMIADGTNLGAVPDPRIVDFMIERRLQMVMEVVRATPGVRSARVARRDDGLVVAGAGQIPPEEEEELAIADFPFMSVNTIWLELAALLKLLEAHNGVLPLPPIATKMAIDPTDPSSPPIIQLGTSMAAVVGLFPDAQLLEVPRDRYTPVVSEADLALLRSDAYVLGEDRVPRLVERG
jgi:UTP--glucose-1-phosphate uridylyltransferase